MGGKEFASTRGSRIGYKKVMKHLSCRMAFFVAAIAPCLALAEDKKPEVQEAAPEIIVPLVEFAETPLSDAVDFMSQKSEELGAELGAKRANIVVLGNLRDQRLTLSLTKVPLEDVLGIMAELVGAQLVKRPETYVIARGGIYEAVQRWEGSKATEGKLNKIRIPSIEFVDTPLADVVDFLAKRSIELDPDPENRRRGVNLVLKHRQPVHVTLRLENVSLRTALEMVALSAGYQVELREHFVVFDLEG